MYPRIYSVSFHSHSPAVISSRLTALNSSKLKTPKLYFQFKPLHPFVPTAYLTCLLGYLINISDKTCPKVNSSYFPHADPPTVFPISEKCNSMLTVAQDKKYGLILSFYLFLRPYILPISNSHLQKLFIILLLLTTSIDTTLVQDRIISYLDYFSSLPIDLPVFAHTIFSPHSNSRDLFSVKSLIPIKTTVAPYLTQTENQSPSNGKEHSERCRWNMVHPVICSMLLVFKVLI